MKRCPNCLVEVEENANFCSLCGEPLIDKTTGDLADIKSGNLRQEEKLLSDYQKLAGYQKRKIFWQISGLILISGVFLTLLIDFIDNQHITWSVYPATVCLVLFINFTLNTFLRKKIILMAILSFLSVTALFILFDVYAGETGWDIVLGLPLILAMYLTFILLNLLIWKSKQKGLNVIAWSLMAAGMFCFYTEGMISVYSGNTYHFSWSLIVMVSVLFISVLLFYIHYRLKKATDLKRFFHI